jgi:hypothetical protein
VLRGSRGVAARGLSFSALVTDESSPRDAGSRGLTQLGSVVPPTAYRRASPKATRTCSSFPPSRVFVTVSDVPDPATLTEFCGFAALQ